MKISKTNGPLVPISTKRSLLCGSNEASRCMKHTLLYIVTVPQPCGIVAQRVCCWGGSMQEMPVSASLQFFGPLSPMHSFILVGWRNSGVCLFCRLLCVLLGFPILYIWHLLLVWVVVSMLFFRGFWLSTICFASDFSGSSLALWLGWDGDFGSLYIILIPLIVSVLWLRTAIVHFSRKVFFCLFLVGAGGLNSFPMCLIVLDAWILSWCNLFAIYGGVYNCISALRPLSARNSKQIWRRPVGAPKWFPFAFKRPIVFVGCEPTSQGFPSWMTVFARNECLNAQSQAGLLHCGTFNRIS